MMETEGADPQAAACGARLQARGSGLAVAESCTGGALGDRLTSVPGASAWFVGGVIAYANALKTGLLGVPPETIAQYGAVSAETAAAMAAGARTATGADVALAVTGILGPSGGTLAKPVGTVYIALAAPDHHATQHYQWTGTRAANKQASVDAALTLLAEYLDRDS